MSFSIIVAVSQNGVIGKNNDLPWRIPEDWKYFKQTTMGHPVLMGRKTFESLKEPLLGRENIVLTRNQNFSVKGATVIFSFAEFRKRDLCQEIFVIGGAQIYRQTLPFVKKVYLTRIYEDFEGDASFPKVDWESEFQLIEKSGIFHSKNKKIPYEFFVYQRRQIT